MDERNKPASPQEGSLRARFTSVPEMEDLAARALADEALRTGDPSVLDTIKSPTVRGLAVELLRSTPPPPIDTQQ